jgi:predicted metal-dependent hydrolase
MIRLLSDRPPGLPEQDCIEFTDPPLHYRIRASHRRRTLALELRADGLLTAAAPAGVPLETIRRFVASRRRWIESKRALLAQCRPPPLGLGDGARLPYLGRVLELHHDAGATGRSLCRRDGDRLVVRGDAPAALRPAIEHWYRRAAAEHFAARVAHFAPWVGRGPRRLAVRAARTRWGSCSARGTISLNWRLMQMPPDVIDYVVVHELCHLLVPNHSPRFWAQVARVLPDWQARRRTLHALGRALPV